MPQSVRLLHVEDSPFDRDLVRDALTIEHSGFIVTSVSSRAEFETALKNKAFDVILTDFNILGFEGLEVIEAARIHYPGVPVIVLTGTGSEEIAVTALQSGASDYVIKTPRHIQRLPQTIRTVLERQNLRRERALAAEQLRRAAQKYQGIFENVSEGVFQTTPDGRYISANPALARIYGYASPEALMDDLNATNLYCDPQQRDVFVAQLHQKGHVENFEAAVRRRDGEIIWIRENARLTWKENGDPLYEGTVEDVTERKRTQEALEAANLELENRVAARTQELSDANEQLQRELAERREIEMRLRRAYAVAESATRAKNEFFSQISHELRTPLNAILGFGQLLEMEDLPAEQEEGVGEIMRAGYHLLELVDEILEIANIESGHLDFTPEAVDVAELIEDCLAQMHLHAHDRDVQLQHDRHSANHSDALYVRADARHLKQALLNLISNAIKFNRAHGTVVISSEALHTNGTKPRSLRISVTDTGPGIAPDKINELFTPFKRLHIEEISTKGAGLGLALTKSLIEAMGGRVGVQSTPDEGSTFWIELPLANPVLETAIK